VIDRAPLAEGCPRPTNMEAMVSPDEMDEPLVLVVEDMDETYELLSDILAAAGFRVVGAPNGIDAVDTAVKLLPDLILMDLSLPLMGGCEATKLLKSDARTRDIPIIALTGHHNFLDMARQAGCDAFLTKPCPPENLLSEVHRMLGVVPSETPKVRIN
jgi:two-component system, cell cycle response regulator DivK